MPNSTRQLAAIMFTDIVGYTKLMGENEQEALQLLRKNRQLHKSIIKKHHGKWLKEMGDGTLASFKTISDAVFCAGTLIKACEGEAIKLRIGIHQGEILVEDGDIFGDGVNVASRLEPLAEPGQILVSGPIHRNVKNKPGISSNFISEAQLKNVDEPVKIYSLKVEQSDVRLPNASTYGRSKMKVVLIISVTALLFLIGYSLSDYLGVGSSKGTNEINKSIALLPLQNISDDENEYLVNAIKNEVAAYLRELPGLKVLSGRDVEMIWKKKLTTREIAQELGVRYLLEGTIWKEANRFKLRLFLSDINADHIVWEEEWDKEYELLMDVVNEVARELASSLDIVLNVDEQKQFFTLPTESPEAYDFYLKGEDYYYRSRKKEDYEFAIKMYERSVEFDPKFTLAWVGLAKASRSLHHFHISPKHQVLAKEYLDNAIALNDDMMEVLVETGRYYYHCELDYQKALEILEVLKLQYPNNDNLFMTIGHIYRRMGQYQKALEHQNKAIELSPYDWTHWQSRSYTLIVLKRYLEAEVNLKKVIELNPSLELGYTDLARMYMITGDTSRARGLFIKHENISPIIECQYEMICKNFSAAVKIIESSADEVEANQYAFLPKSLQLGLIYHTISNKKLAESYFIKSVAILNKYINEYQEDSRLYSSLGIAYAGLGMTEEAVSAGNKALSIMNMSTDALRGFRRELDMLKILLISGDYDEVMSKLEFLIQQNGYLSVELLKIDPFWDPVRKKKAFQELIKNPKYQINR